MVMDYGRAGTNVCVLNSNGKCDMGQSAIPAAENLEYTYGIPASKIALTPMVGVNDTNDEIFTLQDADEMTQYVLGHGLVGIHYWSLDRDTPCSVTSGGTRCNSVPSSTPLGYTKRILSDLGK